jgi:hypothetical protein
LIRGLQTLKILNSPFDVSLKVFLIFFFFLLLSWSP